MISHMRRSIIAYVDVAGIVRRTMVGGIVDMNKLVGIYGYAGSGKTSTADILLNMAPNKFVVKHLADALKQEASKFYEIPIDTFYSTTKKDKKLSLAVITSDNIVSAICNAIGAREYFSPRDLLVAYGSFRRLTDNNYWVKNVMDMELSLNDLGKTILIPDIRYSNEFDELKSRGGVLVRVNRHGYGRRREDDSEKQQEQFKADYSITAADGLSHLTHSIIETKLLEELLK